MHCFACDRAFDSNESMLSHINLCHRFLSSYSCTENDCLRKFQVFNSFRKHCTSKHSNMNNISSEINTSLTEPIVNHTNSENITPVHFSQPKQLNLPEIGNSSPELVASSSNSVGNISSHHSHSEQVENRPNSVVSSSHLFNIPSEIEFLAKLHNYADIPRSRIVSIVADFQNFIASKVQPVENFVLSHLKNDFDDKTKVKQCFDNLKRPFSELETEYRQLKAFEKLGTYTPPQQILLGEREERKKKKEGITTLTHVKSTAEFIPLREVLQKFFETSDILEKTMSYYKLLMEDTDSISNFVQGSFWREKMRLETKEQNDKLIFPLFLYFDDYENNNPLGSHAGIQKCGAVYISIPCIPPEISSKLVSTFLFVLFNSLDRKLFKNERVFKKVIKELTFLEKTGLIIKEQKIYFKLAIILGDNAGLHSILGFTESFNSNYPCRFCFLNSNEIQYHFKEDLEFLRTKENYSEHVTNKVNGVIEECVFHKMDFHVTENINVDAMHDVLEGVCQYDLAKMLRYFISKKLFSLSQLNERIQGFHYNTSDNRIPEIMEIHLKSKLKMSSVEMLSFVKNLGMMIGDLIPEDFSTYWEIYKNLKKILDIIRCSIFHPNLTHYFQSIIEEYLTNLKDVFPEVNLKPKHHYLLHYPRIMSMVGPLWKTSSMRYESKHRIGKMTSRVALCRINVCHTIAVKNQLQLNYHLLSKNFESNIWEGGPVLRKNLNEISDGKIKCILPPNTSEILTMNWIKHFGKKVVVNDSIVIFPTHDGPAFFIIKLIFLNHVEISLILSELSVYFDDHYQAYTIFENCNDFDSYIVRNISSMNKVDFMFSSKHGKFIALS